SGACTVKPGEPVTPPKLSPRLPATRSQHPPVAAPPTWNRTAARPPPATFALPTVGSAISIVAPLSRGSRGDSLRESGRHPHGAAIRPSRTHAKHRPDAEVEMIVIASPRGERHVAALDDERRE